MNLIQNALQPKIRQRWLFILMLALLPLGACSSVPQGSLQAAPRPEGKPNLPLPRPLNLKPVEWQVVSDPANGTLLIATTEQGWKNSQLNDAEVQRFTAEALHQLNYYRTPATAGKLQQDPKAAGKKGK